MKNCRMGMKAKRELYKRIIVPTVIYESELWGLKERERDTLEVFEMKCLSSTAVMTKRDKIMKEVICKRTVVKVEMTWRVVGLF